jgi:hypothetical protein
VTVTLRGAPTVAVDGATTEKWVAMSVPKTVTGSESPVIPGVTVSVAVIVWEPTEFNVTGNIPVPFMSVPFGGKEAAGSLLVNCTVPEYAVVGLLKESSAVTVTLIGAPAIAVDGALTKKCVDVSVSKTVIGSESPVMLGVTVSVAVIVWEPTEFNVAENVPVPFMSMPYGGKEAAGSLLVNCTVPE